MIRLEHQESDSPNLQRLIQMEWKSINIDHFIRI